jgi:hypothetical protein
MIQTAEENQRAFLLDVVKGSTDNGKAIPGETLLVFAQVPSDSWKMTTELCSTEGVVRSTGRPQTAPLVVFSLGRGLSFFGLRILVLLLELRMSWSIVIAARLLGSPNASVGTFMGR